MEKCGYECESKTFECSKTKMYITLKELELKRESNRYDNWDEQKNINIVINSLREELKDDFSCMCGKEYNTLRGILQHEKECLGLKHDIELPSSEEPKVLYSNDSVTCKFCNKEFLHTCQTSTPRHQLNRHAKTCEKTLNRRLKQQIKDGIKDIGEAALLQDIIKLINKHKDNL